MATQYFEIAGRNRRSTTCVTQASDFLVGPSSVESSSVESSSVESNTVEASGSAQPRLTPYCLDYRNQRWLCTETDGAEDLTRAPFYYQAQFERAKRVAFVAFDQVASVVNEQQSSPSHLTFVFSVGRCGSTLVSKLFAELEDTVSISEPDVFSNIHELREARQISDSDARRHLKTAVTWLAAAQPARRLVLKFRGSCITECELLHSLFPEASYLFTYRNAIDCVGSYVRLFGPEQISEAQLEQTLLAEGGRQALFLLGRPASALLNWVYTLQTYLQACRTGMPFAAIRYQDWLSAPEQTAARMFAHCGAPQPEARHVQGVLSRDAQAGSQLTGQRDAQRSALTEEEIRNVHAFLERYSNFRADVCLAHTL